MQLELSDDTQHSIATAAAALVDRLYRETGDRYSLDQMEQILWRCLDAVVENWTADCFEHCTRPAPYGHSQVEFDRLLQRIHPLPGDPPCN